MELESSSDAQKVEASNSKSISCRVCGSNAMSHLQYGAIVCPGCRSFFRRAVVNKKEPKLCLFFQKCGEVRAKKRSICPYCRFQKCLEIGMLRSKVTGVKSKSDAQKRSCPPPDVTLNHKEPRKSKECQTSQCKVMPVCHLQPFSAESCQSIALGQSVLSHASMAPECQEHIPTNSDHIPLRIQEIQNIFFEIYAEVDIPLFLVDHFISGHMNSNAWASSHSKAFLQLIDINIFANFGRFAYHNRFFHQLNPSDKTLLLNR